LWNIAPRSPLKVDRRFGAYWVNTFLTRWQWVCVADVNVLCVQYYEIVLIYCITFIVNNPIILLRNDISLIYLSSFCSTDQFLQLLQILLGKGTLSAASL
jgi:hypothetical protein